MSDGKIIFKHSRFTQKIQDRYLDEEFPFYCQYISFKLQTIQAYNFQRLTSNVYN